MPNQNEKLLEVQEYIQYCLNYAKAEHNEIRARISALEDIMVKIKNLIEG